MGGHSRQDLLRYLHGDLPEAERFRIESHLKTCSECNEFLTFVRNFNATLKEMAATELQPDTPCPDPEVLAAFQVEELDEKTAQLTRQHTVLCKDCLEELFLLQQAASTSKLLKEEDSVLRRSLALPVKTAKPFELSVCIFSQHSDVLRELQQILTKSPFAVFARPLMATSPRVFPKLDLPAAKVYLVDARADSSITRFILASIRNSHPGAGVIVVGKQLTDFNNLSFLRMGARGLLTYEEAHKQLIRAIPLVASGGFWVPRSVLSDVVDSMLAGRKYSLTPLEQKVFRSLLENLSDKEIAGKLAIAQRTVKFHVSNLLNKFGARDRSDLLRMAFQPSVAQP
jgi:DNA-binding NarL/FixJ family response regulator